MSGHDNFLDEDEDEDELERVDEWHESLRKVLQSLFTTIGVVAFFFLIAVICIGKFPWQ